jgi:hypothetical protein
MRIRRLIAYTVRSSPGFHPFDPIKFALSVDYESQKLDFSGGVEMAFLPPHSF